jgi:hypothetical protein
MSQNLNFRTAKEEFDIYLGAIGLKETLEKDSIQYIETKKAFYAGLLCMFGKLSIEGKGIAEPALDAAVETLFEEIKNEISE